MKKRKLIFHLLLFIMFIVPISASASRSSEANQLYDIISKDRKINITSFKTLKIEDQSSYGEKTFDPLYNTIISYYVNNLPGVKDFKQKHSDHDVNIHVFCIDYNNCAISIKYDDKDECDSSESMDDYPFCEGVAERFKVSISVVDNYDDEIMKEVQKHTSSKGSKEGRKTYRLLDMAYINQIMNKADNDDSFLGKSDASNAEMFFPEIKEMYENFPSLKFVYANRGLGAGLGGEEFDKLYTRKYGEYISMYDNTVYGLTYITFEVNNIILVDKNSKDLIAAAKKRIEEYINDPSISVEIKDVTSSYTSSENSYDYYLNHVMNSEFNDTKKYSSSVYELKIGDKITSTMLIVPVDSSYIKKLEVKSIESKTGVKMTTSSHDVPMDATLQIKDVTNNYTGVIKAYNIDLYSSYAKGYIKNAKDGIKLMIPVENNFNPKGKSIYYINSQGKKEQKFDYEIETIDSKKYITFVTDHLSVYAISEDEVVTNPETGNFGKYGILLFTFSIFLIIYIIFRKNTKFPKTINK